MKIIILGQEYVEAPALPPGSCAGCAGHTEGSLYMVLPMCSDLSSSSLKCLKELAMYRYCELSSGKPNIYFEGGSWDWWPNGCCDCAINLKAAQFCMTQNIKGT